MRTQGQLKTAILVKLNQSTTVAFYTDTILSTWISDAHAWAAARHKWPMTEGRISTTFASLSTTEDGYTALEYPEGFRSDSIRLLTIGGKRFLKRNFYKFQSFLEDNPGDTSNLFTDYQRRALINPRATGLSGTVVAWGQYNPLALDVTDPDATTIFTDAEEDGNEAVVEEVLAYAAYREKHYELYTLHHNNAMMILDNIFKRVQNEQYAYQDVDDEGMFARIDVVHGGMRDDLFKRDQFT